MRRILPPLFLLLFALPAFCQVKNISAQISINQWQKNGIVINDSQGQSVRQNAKAVSLDDNSLVIVWEDERNGHTDIYAQRLSASGKKLWGDEGVAVCSSANNQTFPQLINAGSGNVIIAWQDYRNGFSDIYAQKLNVKGAALWQTNGVPVCRAAQNQLAPQLCDDGSGGAFVTWYDYRSGKGEDIYAQRIGSSGSTEWLSDGVPVCAETATQWYPQIVRDSGGGAVICWDDKRNGYYDIYAQRLGSQGNAIWDVNGVPVCSAPENQEYSQIASSEPGTFVITWQDYRNGEADIYAQKITLSGKPVWKTNGEIVCNVAANQERPQLVGGPNPVIVWTDFRNGTGNSDIYCQKMSPAGKPLWDKFGVAVCEAGENQNDPRAVTDGNGGAVIVWQDHRSFASAIFGRRVSSDGKPVWVPEGKTISAPISEAEFPQIVLSGSGNVFVVWQDKREGGVDVFAQSLDLSGGENWKIRGINAVSGFGSVTQQKPKIIKCSADEYIIVFEDYRNGYSNIYAQKINTRGRLIWNRDAVRVCTFKSDQINPELASDGDGGALIVWEDSRSGVSAAYSQRIDAYGNILWDPSGVQVCLVNGDQHEPKICSDSKGGAVIAWTDFRKKDGSSTVYAQKIDKDGNLRWRSDAVAVSTSGGTQTSVKIASDRVDGAVLTWVEFKKNVNANTPDIFAQRVGTDGKLLWDLTGMGVCRAPEAQRNPEISIDDSIMIVWEDSGSGNYDIYAQKMNKEGKITWVCDGIPICTAPFTQHEPKFVLNEDGGATITWEDYRNANWDIFAQRIDGNGGSIWEKDGIPICLTQGTQYAPQIVKSGGTAAIIVWEDYRNNLSYNIYAQKVSGRGQLLWEQDGVPVCVTEGGARNPQIVDDGEGGAIIVWTDYRYGNYDIYAQRINETKTK